MTPEQINIINESIINIHMLCTSHPACVGCPMTENCRGYPDTWEIIKQDKKEGDD